MGHDRPAADNSRLGGGIHGLLQDTTTCLAGIFSGTGRSIIPTPTARPWFATCACPPRTSTDRFPTRAISWGHRSCANGSTTSIPRSRPRKSRNSTADSRNILWAADVWYSIKKHWVRELQRNIQARRDSARWNIEDETLRRAVVLGSALVYWAGVFVQARRIRKRTGRSANSMPRGIKERMLWVGLVSGDRGVDGTALHGQAAGYHGPVRDPAGPGEPAWD